MERILIIEIKTQFCLIYNSVESGKKDNANEQDLNIISQTCNDETRVDMGLDQ